MTRTTALLLASLSLACGDSGKTTDASATSDGTTSPGTTATGSTGAPSTTQATTTATTGPATTSGTTADTTSGTSTTTTTGTTSGTTTTGTSTTTGTTGAACSDNAESCASGEKCCEGLECCAGVPIPPGMETCLAQCPDSDRNLKTDFAALDVHDVLRRVAALDITTWRYKKDAPGVRHLGPMAQDFKAAFGLGDTDRLIFPLDATGVSMAAIQALHHRLVAAEAENDDLRARLDRMDRRLVELEAR